MKSILLTFKPTEAENILNDKQKIIVRKKFPKDYKGWVYIYCTKGKKHQDLAKDETTNSWKLWYGSYRKANGKVVARFWCDKVEEITTEKWSPSKEQDLLKASCLTENQLFDYCNLESGKPFYAIHISKLEIFDEPRELREFEKYGSYKRKDIKCKNKDRGLCNYALSLDGNRYVGCEKARLTKAPKNYCYIEEEVEYDKQKRL